jgi:hypothetical protein
LPEKPDQSYDNSKELRRNWVKKIPKKETTPPMSLWQAITLIIILTFGIVTLFAFLVYLFINGIQQLGFPPIVNLVIFVIISGIFAWLIKRLTDIVSGMSHLWFPEEMDDERE